MAKNYNSLGEHITFDSTQNTVKAGEFVKTGDIWGVALTDDFLTDVSASETRREVVVATEGVWTLEVDGTYSFGKSVYFNSGTGLTFTAEGNGIPVGVAVGTDTVNGVSAIKVRIQQSAKAAIEDSGVL